MVRAPGQAALSGADDETATVTVMRELPLSPLHPIQVLLRRRLLTLSLVFAPVAGFTTIAFFWVLPFLRAFCGARDLYRYGRCGALKWLASRAWPRLNSGASLSHGVPVRSSATSPRMALV